jgi:hypothetical protein
MSLDGPFNITLDSNDVTFNILGDEKLRLTSLGNLGIGTTAPGAKLHIDGISPSVTGLKLRNTSGVNRALEFFNSANEYRMGFHYDNENIRLYVVDTQRNPMVTFSGANGNVGIGTTSPNEKLHVVGTLLISDGAGGGVLQGPDINHSIHFRTGNDGTADVLDFNEYGSMRFFTGGEIQNQTERMRITSDGKVGIGTTDPQAPLDVNGYIRAAYDTNSASYFGRAVIGYNHTNAQRGGTYDDWASFSHLDMKHSTGYALLHSAQGETIINAAYEYPIHFCNNDQKKITMASNGYLGIGLDPPSYPLHINNYVAASLDARYFRYIHDLHWPTSNVSFQVSLFAAGGIFSNGIIGATSDRRIKKDIVEINDDTALQQIRLLKPSKYRYRDYINRGTEEVIGFIAQEVKEVIPQAVKILTDDIPNVMLMGSGLTDASDNHIITIPDYDTSSLEVDASGNIFPKLKIVIDEDDKDKELFVNIQEVISTTKLKVELIDDDITELPSEIFIYGQEVDNKHILVKDRIFAVGMSALQEVDRQLQAEKTKTASLETKVASLETQVADILQRLSNAGIINKNNY